MHQEPMQKVQLYYDNWKGFFVKGHILDVERQKWFMAKLQLELKELLVVCTYQYMDELLSTTLEVVKVLGKIKETPYEAL